VHSFLYKFLYSFFYIAFYFIFIFFYFILGILDRQIHAGGRGGAETLQVLENVGLSGGDFS